MSHENSTAPNAPALPADLWVMRIPVVSSGHLDRVTMENLISDDAPFDLCVITYREGAIVSIPENWTVDGDGTFEDEEAESALPDDLTACLRWAGRHGFVWIRFDRDGDHIDGLQTFDW